MKRIFLMLLVVSALFEGRAQASEPDGFEVKFKVLDTKGGYILYKHLLPNVSTWKYDTLALDNKGQAVLKGKVDYPHWLECRVKPVSEHEGKNLKLFLDNSRIQIQLDCSGADGTLEVKGAEADKKYHMLRRESKIVVEAYIAAFNHKNQMVRENKTIPSTLEQEYKTARTKALDFFTSLPNYAYDPIIACLVYEIFNQNFDLEILDEALSKFDPSMDANGYVAESKKKVINEKRILPGQTAYDFTLSDLQGKTYKLSDFRGKYVLLEFSASWCHWCKKEVPYLKQVYEMTKDENFVMLTVNLDQTRDRWEKDVRELNLPWPVISDLKAYSGPVTKNYSITGIPKVFLISPDGKIIDHSLRRERLVQYIKDMYNKSINQSIK